ncbi:MAG: hypothetical protein KDD47_15205, partial [Acidobacteria bacterium]|nr:hypothetical protein [Acidobacteriota bacterium]
ERQDLPSRVRLALGFLRVTLYLPLGGLFVTLWPILYRWLEARPGAQRRLERALAAPKEA